MKPELLFITTPEGKSHAYLIDADAVFTAHDEGKNRVHYATAIALRGCISGQVELTQPDESGNMAILAPAPCVLSIRKGMKKADLEARKLDPLAAAAMLRLAAAAQNVQASFTGKAQWNFGDLIERNPDPEVMAAPSPAKMLVAWKWTGWTRDGVNGAAQLADMRRFGYQGTAKNLRDIRSTLGLVRAKES